MPSYSVALIALGFLTAAADATAIASVKEAFWQADFAWYDDGVSRSSVLPSGVVLGCTGTATANGSGGCRDAASAKVVSASGVWEATTVDRFGGLILRASGAAAPGGTFGFTARFSSFYPADPDTGAFVGDGAAESADYFTVVEGAGGFDLHGCNMTSGPGHGGSHHCRPDAPIVQNSVFTLGASPDWRELAADWRIYIQVSAQGEAADAVPEPPTLALFVAAAAFTAYRRKVRSPFRQSSTPACSTTPSRLRREAGHSRFRLRRDKGS